MKSIRRAKPEDAELLHKAHMRSIEQVCAQDYSAEEIRAWGFKPFHRESRLKAIETEYVWVIESDQTIEGYGHFGTEMHDNEKIAHIYGLYLAPEALRQGLGQKILKEILKEVKALGIRKIFLESTLTAYRFYLKQGFKDIGDQTTISIGGHQIRCVPMAREL